VLKRFGVAWELLDPQGCIRQEPALARVREKFVGGLWLPGDETGDCFKFTGEMAKLAHAAGVDFRFGTDIRRLRAQGGRIEAVDTDQGALTADAYLMALGSYSPLLLRPLGLQLPVYPVKGYSLTVPIDAPRAARVRSRSIRPCRRARSSRWCRWTWWWTTRSWSTTTARPTRST
jgi:D-amino-acid dehydrogenase